MDRRHKALAEGALGGGAAPTYTISGTVYDADGSTAVEGATVALGALTAESGADGTYTIADVPAETSGSMTCTLAGYSWTAISVAAMSGNLTAQDFDNAWWATGGIGASCVAAYQPKGAASLAASYVNLANSGTYDAAPGSAPAWDAVGGWTFADTHWLTTGITPAVNYSMIARFSDATARAEGNCVCGCGSVDTNRFYLMPGLDASNRAFGYGKHKSFAGAVENGVMAIAGQNCYYNGVADGTTAGTFSTGAVELQIGRRWKGSADFELAGKVQAIAVYSITLTAPQVVALTTAINNLP